MATTFRMRRNNLVVGIVLLFGGLAAGVTGAVLLGPGGWSLAVLAVPSLPLLATGLYHLTLSYKVNADGISRGDRLIRWEDIERIAVEELTGRGRETERMAVYYADREKGRIAKAYLSNMLVGYEALKHRLLSEHAKRNAGGSL